MTSSLEQVLADWRERASALTVTGHKHDADLVEKVLDDVVSTLPEYLSWLTEGEAMMYEGRRTPDALRQSGSPNWRPAGSPGGTAGAGSTAALH